MANATYKLKLDRTDRVFPPAATFQGGVRIRPGETVEVDLAVAEQDAAFDESKYDVVVATPHKQPFAAP